MALEGLVALLLVVLEALEVHLPRVPKGLVVRLLVVLLPEALVVLTVLILEINPHGRISW